jgi:hypothetical protein
VEEVALFRRILKLSRWPQPLRRLLWWGNQFSGPLRVRRLGTFGVSTLSGFGAVSPHLLTAGPATLNYGVVESGGAVDVYLTFDQRVLDAGPAARCLEQTEQVLHGEVLAELQASQEIRD